jgi:hypothetical protein
VTGILLLLFLASGMWAQINETGSSVVLAILNVNLIPLTTADVRPAQTVIIRGGRISETGPAGKTLAPQGALRIDGTGRYLMPGLFDSHVHFQPDEITNRAFLTLFLVNGVTSVLNLYGTPVHLKLRAAVDRDEIPGPQIFTSGPWVGTPHGQTPTTTPEQITREVAAQKQAGYDFIKLHGDLSAETYRRLMAAAREQRIRVVGHAPRNLGVAPMLEERQPAVAHLEEYLYACFYYGADSQEAIPGLDEKIRKIAAATAKAGTAIISTMEVYRGIADQIGDVDGVLNRPQVAYLPFAVGAAWGWWPPENTYVRRFGKDQIPRFRANHHVLERLTLGAQQAGVRLLAGTDTPTPAVVPGFSIHDELRDLVKAGLTPYQALQTATVNPAAFLGCLRDSGTIERGKRADCVLLKGNPLEDIANTASIAGVVRNGRWISAAQIDTVLKRLANPKEGRNQRSQTH